VRALTADVQQALRRQALHVDDRRLEQMVTELADTFADQLAVRFEVAAPRDERQPEGSLIKRWLWKALGWYHRSSAAAGQALEQRVLSRQHISTVLSQALERDPRAVTELRNHLERYKDHLDQTRLRQALHRAFDQRHSTDQPVREGWIRLRMTLFAVAMAPVALFGLVHNALPYAVTKLAPRMFRDEAVRTFAYFGIGVLAFLATYTGLGYWLWQSAGFSPAWTLAYLAALPPTGFAALGYRRTILVYRDRILVRTLVFDRAQLVALLRREREVLFARFEALAERFGA